MTLEELGLVVLFLLALMCLSAYRSNKQADKSWHEMRRALTPDEMPGWREMINTGLDMEMKTFYSQHLMSRLYPAMKHAAESGHYHAILPGPEFYK